MRLEAISVSWGDREEVVTRRSRIVGIIEMEVALRASWILGIEGWWKTSGTRRLATCPFSKVLCSGVSSGKAQPLQ